MCHALPLSDAVLSEVVACSVRRMKREGCDDGTAEEVGVLVVLSVGKESWSWVMSPSSESGIVMLLIGSTKGLSALVVQSLPLMVGLSWLSFREGAI